MDYKKFLELYQRGQTGKKVSKEDWDMEYIVDTMLDYKDEYECFHG